MPKQIKFFSVRVSTGDR